MEGQKLCHPERGGSVRDEEARVGELARGRQKLGPFGTIQREQAGSSLVPRLEGSGDPSQISDLCPYCTDA